MGCNCSLDSQSMHKSNVTSNFNKHWYCGSILIFSITSNLKAILRYNWHSECLEVLLHQISTSIGIFLPSLYYQTQVILEAILSYNWHPHSKFMHKSNVTSNIIKHWYFASILIYPITSNSTQKS